MPSCYICAYNPQRLSLCLISMHRTWVSPIVLLHPSSCCTTPLCLCQGQAQLTQMPPELTLTGGSDSLACAGYLLHCTSSRGLVCVQGHQDSLPCCSSFDRGEDADYAWRKMDGIMLHGRKLKVEWATPSE